MAETTTNSPASWSPDIVATLPGDAIPDALVLTTSTVAGKVEGDDVAARVPWVDDATAGFVDEGSDISEADPTLSETVVFTGKIAQLLKISREQFTQNNTSNLLSESVRRAVTKAADKAYLTQAAPGSGEHTPPAGLLNVSGIVDGGTIATDLDVLAEGLATLEANGSEPTHIICAPDAFGYLRKFKTATDSNMALLGAGVQDQAPMLMGLPVIRNAAMTSGKLLVVDRSAIVSAVGTVNVAQSNDVYFASDSVGLRCTFRFGASVMHADRIAQFTVTDPDAS